MPPKPIPATARSSSVKIAAFWWLGGILAALPFLIPMIFGFSRAPWVLGPGHFGDNVVLGTWWVLSGASLGGLIARILFTLDFKRSVRIWWHEKRSFHWGWFFFTIVIFGFHNHLVLDGFPFSWAEKLSTMFGRILTGMVIIGLYWLACGLTASLAPKKFRRIPWLVAAFIPAVLVADYISMLIWRNPLRNIINVIDSNGSFDLGSALAGGGVAVPSLLVIIGVGLLVYAMYRLFFWTGKLQWTPIISFRRWAFAISVLSIWGGVWAEKTSGMGWKSRNALRWEHHRYRVHLTQGLKPPMGVVEYEVAFKQEFELDPEVGATAEKKPDIYVFMVESLRHDALHPEHAPFLSQFRDEECQDLGQTWACSNATMLSWYGIFRGVFPIHWPGDRAEFFKTEQAPLPPWFSILKQAGYRNQVRTVGILSFMNKVETSFGSDLTQFHEFVQTPMGEIDWRDYYKQIPDREKAAFESAKQSVREYPAGKSLQFIALDSTHWGYFWPDDFELPYPEYFAGGSPPAFPSDEDILLLKRRYYNAVSWVDHQIGDFVSFLKEEGRYEDSIIIVTGDHGEEFHENGSWFHSSSLHPVQVQVPILVKWPQGTEAPELSSASHLDLLPSLIDYLGVEANVALPGRSLLKEDSGERTQMSFACNTGVTGVCMAWYREGFTATFRWKNPWSHDTPERIHLDDILDPSGKTLNLETSADWNTALMKHFPDAADRMFKQLEMAEEE